MSEKLDGVRAFWSGSNFYSRQGNSFHAPDFFKKGLPKIPLDGELWVKKFFGAKNFIHSNKFHLLLEWGNNIIYFLTF